MSHTQPPRVCRGLARVTVPTSPLALLRPLPLSSPLQPSLAPLLTHSCHANSPHPHLLRPVPPVPCTSPAQEAARDPEYEELLRLAEEDGRRADDEGPAGGPLELQPAGAVQGGAGAAVDDAGGDEALALLLSMDGATAEAELARRREGAGGRAEEVGASGREGAEAEGDVGLAPMEVDAGGAVGPSATQLLDEDLMAMPLGSGGGGGGGEAGSMQAEGEGEEAGLRTGGAEGAGSWQGGGGEVEAGSGVAGVQVVAGSESVAGGLGRDGQLVGATQMTQDVGEIARGLLLSLPPDEE